MTLLSCFNEKKNNLSRTSVKVVRFNLNFAFDDLFNA